MRPSTFEKKCGFANGYLGALKDSPSAERVEVILKTFPQLSRVWLLAGEGPMLNDGKADCNAQVGEYNTIVGENSQVNTDAAIIKAMEVAAKSQEHIDRLLAIIEKLT